MCPRKYGFSGSITGAASKTIWSVTATAAVRPAIKEVMISSNATPSANNSSEWQVLRYTAAGTSTAVVPEQGDTADPAATSVCGKNHTVEPTYPTTISYIPDFAHNQLATVRWVAADGEEPIAPATAAHGFGMQCQGVGGVGVLEIGSVVFYE